MAASTNWKSRSTAPALRRLFPVGLVERDAYRDVFDFAQTLGELNEGKTSGVPVARKNAYEVAKSVRQTMQEEVES